MAKRKPIKAESTSAGGICPNCGGELDDQTHCWKCGGFRVIPEEVCPTCHNILERGSGLCWTCKDFKGNKYEGIYTEEGRYTGLVESVGKAKLADPKMAQEAQRLITSILTGQYQGPGGNDRLRGRYQDMAKEWPDVGWEENANALGAGLHNLRL